MSDNLVHDDYPVELTAPDIEPYRAGNTDIAYVTTFDSGRPGPHVLVTAITHGNEICGAIALDRLMRAHVRPRQGQLTLSFNNHMAYAQFDPRAPDASRFVDEDFNRVWLESRLDSDDNTAELRRARELRPLFERVDVVLDIHSMGTFSKPILICNGLEKERLFTRKMDYPGHIMCGSGHVVGKRIIDYTPFQRPTNDKIAVLVECGQHWAQATGEIAVNTACKFLVASGAVAPTVVEPLMSEHGRQATRAQMWDVTHGVTSHTEDFRFTQRFVGMEIIERAGTVIAHDGGMPITTPYDDCLLMMPNYKPGAAVRKVRLCKRVG